MNIFGVDVTGWARRGLQSLSSEFDSPPRLQKRYPYMWDGGSLDLPWDIDPKKRRSLAQSIMLSAEVAYDVPERIKKAFIGPHTFLTSVYIYHMLARETADHERLKEKHVAAIIKMSEMGRTISTLKRKNKT